jgi:hypothetical protein
MFNGVKSFSKVQFNNEDFLLGLVALMNIFKGPG